MLPVPPADALEWADLWARPDQRGAQAFDAEDHGRAAELFSDPSWSAAALYRTGEYAQSAERLGEIDTAEAHYNRGNALARAGELAPAIEAYERALELDPEHEDALFNRDLLLEQSPPQSEGQEQGDPNQQDSDQEGQQSESQQAASQSSDQTESADPESMSPEDAEASAASEASSQSQNADPNAPEEFDPLPTPGELEEWASEQAADQWLRRIPEDPGGLLRRKFLFQYQRLGVDQDGNYVWPGDEEQPW
jgi:Ca-activated chloride channel family protein